MHRPATWLLALPLLAACGSKGLDSDIVEHDRPGPTTPTPTGGVDTDTPIGTGPGTGATATGTGTGTGSTQTAGNLVVTITENDFMVPEGDPVRVRAAISGTGGDPVEVTWSSSLDGTLETEVISGDGEAILSTRSLRPGWHDIIVTVTHGTERTSSYAVVPVCRYPDLVDFDSALPSGWTLYNDAGWDPGGWLEITGNEQSRRGAIFKTDRQVNPGNVAIEFDIATGGGINTGADGYAVTVVPVPDLASLDALVAGSANGGCLAYGWAEPCGTMTATAFHIEFDTWYNGEYNDPVSESNHVAITLDGDPSTHYFVAEIPSLEDLAWRHVRVETEGETVRVFIDDVKVIEGQIAGFSFEGGYIGVSGSTGWATNHHRFDNLQLYDACVVP